jgi:hypothetical protein
MIHDRRADLNRRTEKRGMERHPGPEPLSGVRSVVIETM